MPAVGGRRHRHAHPCRRPSANRLLEQLADDRVERDLRGLAQALRLGDVQVDPQAVRRTDLVGKGVERSREPLVAQHDRFEREREVAELPNRRPLPVERAREHLLGVLELAGLDRMHRRVEHQRDPGEVLDRAVVQKERDPPPLVLLGCDQSIEALGGHQLTNR